VLYNNLSTVCNKIRGTRVEGHWPKDHRGQNAARCASPSRLLRPTEIKTKQWQRNGRASLLQNTRADEEGIDKNKIKRTSKENKRNQKNESLRNGVEVESGVDLIKKFRDNATWSQLMKTSGTQTNREEEQKPTEGKWMRLRGGGDEGVSRLIERNVT
jgi:hypothetical protein